MSATFREKGLIGRPLTYVRMKLKERESKEEPIHVSDIGHPGRTAAIPIRIHRYVSRY